jgi:hypothetical protein
MSFVELFQYSVFTQGSCLSACSDVEFNQPGCLGSSFTAVGAAFATQGYFAQADLLWQLTNTDLGLWAPLLYVVAAIGGLIGVAMGMPPKMYLWFFMGPAIYSFLLGTTVPQFGTAWCVAGVAQNQARVWQLSEVGLLNSNIVARSRATPGDFYNGEIKIYQEWEPGSSVEVSYFFSWFDSLVSSTVQAMTVWTGIYQQRGGDDNNSGIIKAPNQAGEVIADQYYLMSNLKWSILDKITSARLHNGDVRDAFVTFMSSECGDALARSIDPGNLIAASNSKSGGLPLSIFRGVEATGNQPSSGAPGGSCNRQPGKRNYNLVTKSLANQMIPIPRSVRRSWWNPDRQVGASPGSPGAGMDGTLPGFYKAQKFKYAPATPLIPSFGGGSAGGFLGGLNGIIGGINGVADAFRGSTQDADKAIDRYLETEDNISCADLMYYTLNGFRWEAGQIFYQLVSTAPQNMNDNSVIFNLFYGWDLKNECGQKLEGDELRNFLMDLILVHLVRNELSIAPKVVDSRFLQQGVAAGNASNRYVAETGAKAKFGEVYTWALMMPYVQGVLLYLLAMAYPFVCVMIVVPGWHKTLFTWMAFWTWVKLWDLGFAVVLVLERSIWASMGNNSTAAALSGKVAEMSRWGFVTVSDCSRIGDGKCPPVPTVVDGLPTLAGSGQKAWEHLLALLDRSMLVGSSIDFDIQNGYYIYIMSALYFAVPAVTGQLVLGAKAGAASMATNLAQGAQSDGGRAASQAFTGGLRNQVAGASAAVGQESYRKNMASQGLAAQAIQAGNEGLDMGLLQGMNSAASQNTGLRGQNLGNAMSRSQAALGLASAYSNQKIAFSGSPLTQNAWSGRQGFRDAGDSAVTSQAKAQYDAGGGGTEAAPPGTGSAPGQASGFGPTGAGPTGEGEPGKASVGGGAPKAIGNIANAPGAASKIVQPWVTPSQMVSMSQAAAGDSMAANITGMQAQIAAQQAGYNAAGFGFSSAQNGLGVAERRLGSQADFAAQSAAFDNRRDYANQTSPYLSALGVDSGVVGPGNKPTDMMGMAMTGMLGSSTKQAAGYATPGSGGFWSARQSSMQWLGQNASSAQVQSAYSSFAMDMQAAAQLGDNQAAIVQQQYSSPVARIDEKK